MCCKVILENGGALMSVPCRYKNQKMRKVVDNYLHALKFVPECFKTQKKNLIKLSILILLQYILLLNAL